MKLGNGHVYPAENANSFSTYPSYCLAWPENVYNCEETANSLKNIHKKPSH